MKALQFSRFGGPEVLEYGDAPLPRLDEGAVLVAVRVAGLNFADVYRRRGDYRLEGAAPWINGYEGSGVVLDTRSPDFAIGDRVAFADVPRANAQYVAAPAERLIPVPEGMDLRTPAALLLQGLTAQYLCRDSRPVRAGEIVAIHSAATGVGRLLVQMCRAAGAEVIGLSRSMDKLPAVFDAGAEHAAPLDDRWVETVLELTEGRGADVVFDAVGATLQGSLDAVRERGTVVFYGMSGGDPALVDPRRLMDASKTLVGGDLWSWLVDAASRRERAARLFADLESGAITAPPTVEFDLREGAEAHALLESGRGAAKILLLPDAGD